MEVPSNISLKNDEMSKISEIHNEQNEDTQTIINLENSISQKSEQKAKNLLINSNNYIGNFSLNKNLLNSGTDSRNTPQLKFNYNANSNFKIQNPKKQLKFNKGLTLSENAINKLFKKQIESSSIDSQFAGNNTNNQIKPKECDSNYSGSVKETQKAPRRKKRSTLKGLGGVNHKGPSTRANKKRLHKYKTFQAELDEQQFENFLAGRFSNITNLNIHININQVNQTNPKNKKSKSNVNEGMEAESKIVEENDNTSPDEAMHSKNNKRYSRRKSEKMWALCKKTIKMAKGFTQHNVTKIDLPGELVDNIEEYKKQKEKNSPRKAQIIANNPSLYHFLQKSELDKELIRVNLREMALKVITEGSKNYRRELDEIFEKNLERFLVESNNPNFLFNQPLPDTKKTLFYTACQEGNLQIVNYFLEKDLNPSVISKTDANEYESCLEVAARWNYVDIVKALLNSDKLNEHEIRDVLAKNKLLKLKNGAVKALNEYLNKKYPGKSLKKKGCACF